MAIAGNRSNSARGALLLFAMFAAHAPLVADAMPIDARSQDEISAALGTTVSVRRSPATGAVRRVRVLDLSRGDLAPVSGSLDARARQFLAAHGSLFGVRDAREELFLVEDRTDFAGHRHLTYRQFHRGVPVFAGILKAHFDGASRLHTVNGNFVPALDLDVIPVVGPEAGSQAALRWVADRNGLSNSTTLSASLPKLEIYRTGLDRGVEGSSFLVWDVTVTDGGNIREFIFVDARTGKVVDWLPGIHEAMNRRAFLGTDGNGDQVPDAWPASPNWVEGNAIPSGVVERDNMLLSTADVYSRFNTGFGHDSYDDAGHLLDQAYNRNYSCPNASWNGNLISFCSGFTTHDVTAHEWGHAYTEYTHGLIYRWQSGALNEAYSDIWGEAFDQKTTIAGMVDTDAPNASRTAGTCTVSQGGTDNSVRWLMGEDVAGFGALRDMWHPNCFGDPGKVSDTQYHCATSDNGGVHFNSGVPNHAFALLVDGGTYNSQTVSSIGFVKAVHLYYRAQTVYQVADSDFVDHANALEDSCADLLVGPVSLPDPWGGANQTLTAADCTEVADAMLAVQMRTPPTQCNFQPLLAQNPPPICGAEFAYPSYAFDWEGGASGWTVSRRNVANPGTFDPRDWSIVSSLPDARPGSAFLAPDPIVGDCVADDESGVLVLESPVFRMPLGGMQPRLVFDHQMVSETTWDGGNLKLKVGAGAFTVVPPANYVYNVTTGNLATAGAGNTNPMAGERAWHGTDGGSNGGTWGRTIANLSSLVPAGQTFQLRYEFGSDGCNGTLSGWFVDDVSLFTCHASVPIFLDGFEVGSDDRW